MAEMYESNETDLQPSPSELLNEYWWLILISVLGLVIVLVDTIASGSYDSLTMLLGLILGVAAGWLAFSKAAVYLPPWAFWTLVGLLGLVWLINVIVGAYVMYSGWVFGLLFSLPFTLSLSLLAFALLTTGLAPPRR